MDEFIERLNLLEKLHPDVEKVFRDVGLPTAFGRNEFGELNANDNIFGQPCHIYAIYMNFMQDKIDEKSRVCQISAIPGDIYFQKLYDGAAGKMLSQDREIGLAVLYSYDYMFYFHNCFVEYYKNPTEFDDKKDSYIQLIKKLF